MIVSTAFHRSLLESLAHEAHKPVVFISLREDFVEQIMRALRSGLLYFVVADPRFADKLPAIYGAVEGARNLRTIVAGEQDPGDIPADAAVYVTRAAEAKPGGSAVRRTISSGGRVFCDATAAELLRVIVRSNIAAMQHAPGVAASEAVVNSRAVAVADESRWHSDTRARQPADAPRQTIHQ